MPHQDFESGSERHPEQHGRRHDDERPVQAGDPRVLLPLDAHHFARPYQVRLENGGVDAAGRRAAHPGSGCG